MTDNDIMINIKKILKGTAYELKLFERDKHFFGNIIIKIESSSNKYTFITDRDDIFCNNNLVFAHEKHVVGKDDTPIYLLKVIETVIGNRQ